MVLAVMLSPALISATESQRLVVSPSAVQLHTPESTQQLLVTWYDENNIATDVTHLAQYRISDPTIARVDSSGQLQPLRDGTTQLTISQHDKSVTLDITIKAYANPQPISFRHQIIPILSKAGCNAGGCHGKAEGQQGFRLSVFGYDAEADYQAIVLYGKGRRIFVASPQHSLLRQKAIAEIPHGGGRKIEPGSLWDRILLRWISEGAQLDAIPATATAMGSQTTEKLQIEPSSITLPALGQQQLRVIFTDQAGQQTCVTADAQFQSNEDSIAAVDQKGVIRTTENPGEAAILVRYLGKVAVCRVTRPRQDVQFKAPASHNFVDEIVWQKLAQLNIQPSPVADDATFLRRVYIDTIGTLPTAQEAKDFLNDTSPDKRFKLIQRLLQRPEYADYWALRWSDLLQVDKDTIPPESAVAMTRWIRKQIASNKPYDEFARSILTAEGSILSESPAPFYQVQNDPEKLARSVSQLFLGVRIECAQCHHHPLERWDQRDYYALAGFFTGLERKNSALSGVKIVATPGRELIHPRTQNPVPVAVLGGEPVDLESFHDRRQILANWITDPQNPYFAKLIVNRLWAHYMGRGLIEPLDDLRDTNPASNERLMEALVQHLIDVKFDLKMFTETILSSQVYQLSHVTNDSNRLDEQNYSHARWRPIPAEVLLDAVSHVTGVPESFNGWPVGYRAIQIWDNKLPSHFFEVFGRPRRLTVCACERGDEPSMEQALHLMNATSTAEKIVHPDGNASRLGNSASTDEEVIQEIYLGALARYPTDAEKQRLLVYFQDTGNRHESIEDLLWVLMNNREFVFNH
jgi:hypothetical protein